MNKAWTWLGPAVFSALFSLFTVLLSLGHVRFLVRNQTSVESLSISYMRDRESETLSHLVPMCDWRAPIVHRRRETIRKEWDHEWGKLDTEGNIWWLGSARANWEHRMGKNPWGWFRAFTRPIFSHFTY